MDRRKMLALFGVSGPVADCRFPGLRTISPKEPRRNVPFETTDGEGGRLR